MVKEEEVRAAYETGKLNEYFYNQYQRRTGFYSEPEMDSYMDEAKIMSQIGINNNQEQKEWFYIYTFADKYLEDLVTDRHIRHELMPAIQAEVYANRDKYPINTHIGHMFALARAAHVVGLDLDKDIEKRLMDTGFIDKDSNNVLNIGPVLAYPQDWVGLYSPNPYDIRKWMKATRDIYLRAQQDHNLDEAFRKVTENWDKMETIDYKHWLRFYQENAQNKYKIAQEYENPNSPMLYTQHLRSNLPAPVMPHIEHGSQDSQQVADRNEARDRIEVQRSKIISRLHAAEKLLSSLDGQLFAGEDQEYMLKMLQDLKRKVQTANKISISSTLFEDYIYRAANYCKDVGKTKASHFFYKVAQAEELDMGGGPGAPPPPGTDPAAELSSEKDDALPKEDSPDLDMDLPAPSGDPSTVEATKEAFKEFFARLETGISEELNDHDDGLSLDDQGWIREAQAVPPGEISPIPDAPPPPGGPTDMAPTGPTDISPTPPEGPSPAPTTGDLEVTEDEAVPSETEAHEGAIEAALGDVTVQDVINRLEIINAMLKKRDIARQLSIADLELDQLGINAYFPGLGEAHRSALESTQYMATRVEEILSKLKGASTDVPEEMFSDEEEVASPETAGVKQSLEKLEKDEEERKRRRREREDARAAGKDQEGAGAAAPTELAGPAAVEPGRPIPVR